MYIAKIMNSTTPIPSLMAGAAKLAKELAGRKAEANAGAVVPISGEAPDALDVSSITILLVALNTCTFSRSRSLMK